MIALFPTLAASLFLLAPQTAPSPEETAAAERLKNALTATGLTFATSASGLSYTVVFDNADKRKQTVFISVKPGKKETMAHILYTNVWVGTEAPDEALMRNVLAKSKKLGAYYLFKDTKGTWSIRFGAHFDASDLKPTSASGEALVTTLKDMLYFVNQVGEETDKELNGTKDNR